MASSTNELVITRVFNVTRDLVWKAWTDPDHFRRWWGPKDFTAPACKMDLRVGGTYHWGMRGPDGKDYWTTGSFREIVPMERLVYTDNFADENGNVAPASSHGLPGDWSEEMIVTVTLEEADGRTVMTLRHTGLPAGTMKEMTGTGWNQSFDKLAESVK